MVNAAWDQKIEDFFEPEFDASDPNSSLGRMKALVSDRPAGDTAALFELGGVHDALGLEDEAILYDEGRYGDPPRTALLALIPTLDGYGRALKEYAEELPKTLPAP